MYDAQQLDGRVKEHQQLAVVSRDMTCHLGPFCKQAESRLDMPKTPIEGHVD
jgi:hypothetical protein